MDTALSTAIATVIATLITVAAGVMTKRSSDRASQANTDTVSRRDIEKEASLRAAQVYQGAIARLESEQADDHREIAALKAEVADQAREIRALRSELDTAKRTIRRLAPNRPHDDQPDL